MKIFIRADGGKSIGMGHVMRMLALASELKKNNEVIFITRKATDGKYDAGIQKIKENGFEVIDIFENDIIKNIIEIERYHNAEILITDSYDVNEEYFNSLKPYFGLIGYVDDVNKCYMNVDFIINQNINAKYIDYSKTTKEDTKMFLGPQYCMLREEFKIACNEKQEKDSVEDILLTLGGMDDNNNTMKVLDNIKDLKQRIHVVLANAFDDNVKKQVYNLSKQYKNIYPYENANMSELMKICDIAISACGSTI
ncbi:UDP-2,4-diacetamido-2,4,6-trideoxy-beta-L-altropyranose hydrolase, partial [Clostridium neonatale]|uniref:UDP-2,4-diacetamido-2,4, 6-trideoxy-beta-L-altropyranose hydrolase n=1 Tax=Clostridium neonatale TaxID=137838 RepID=UPI003D352934